jgi:hypothetical protein
MANSFRKNEARNWAIQRSYSLTKVIGDIMTWVFPAALAASFNKLIQRLRYRSPLIITLGANMVKESGSHGKQNKRR